MINFSKFTHFLGLWTKPKEAISDDKVSEVISTPDNVCPKCSSDSGFLKHGGSMLKFWQCKTCYREWMTINQKPND
ncbi:MAG: hypothetical protein V3W20_13540 [Candidatus Neomarinimicrobiota bacterium]